MKSLLLVLCSIALCLSCSSTKKTTAKASTTEKIEVAEQEQPMITGPAEHQEELVMEELPEKPETPAPPVAVELVTELFDHSIFNALLEAHVTPEGIVNYKGFLKDKAKLNTYLEQLANQRPEDSWTHEDKLAYWMNVYNAFTIKLIMNNYPVKSIKDIKDPWDARFFKLGKKWYNLNEVEHKILRKMGDARIHFGINCASFSCPPLLNKAFTAENVDAELALLAKRFINDSQRNTITNDRIAISKIFQWFSKDFKTDGSLIDFLNKYSEITINKNAKKTYLKYNWELNE